MSGAEAAAPARTARGELRLVLASTLLVQAMATWAMLAIPSVAPLAAAGLGVKAVLVGWQIALLYVAAATTSAFAGGLTGRWGAVRASQVAMVACAAGLGLSATGHLAGVALASLVTGFGYGLTNPASSHLLASRTTAQDRNFVFSIKQTGVPLGGALAGLVTPSLALAFGWQAAVAALVPVALIMAAALQPLRRWDDDRARGGGLGSGAVEGGRLIWRDRRLRAVCLCAFCFGIIQLSLMSFVVAFAVEDLAFGALAAGALLAAVQAAGAGGRLGWGWLADRVRTGPGVMAGIALVTASCCVGFALLGADSARWVVFAVAMVFGLSAVGWNGVYLAEVARLAPDGKVGAATGAASVVTFSGVVAGPAGFVLLHDLLGSYGAAYLVLAIPALVGGGFALQAARR